MSTCSLMSTVPGSSSIEDESQRAGAGDLSGVCRNYLRGSCQRGMACAYRHLQPHEVVKHINDGHDLCRTIFCRDFQKLSCRRSNCKLIHASADEEDHFRQTGRLPSRLNHLEALGGNLSGSQGYMQSMYTSALAQSGLLNVSRKRPAEDYADRDTYVAEPPAGWQKEREELKLKVSELELEVKALQSMNKTLLHENYSLKEKFGVD